MRRIKQVQVGLLDMALGNCSSALTSFEKALELLQKDSSENDRQIRLVSKRIKQVREILGAANDS